MTNLAYTPMLVKASAGTGKTTGLANRYIALLADNEIPEHILATTFTKKAAGEIRDRIMQRLAAAALDEEAAEKLAAATERDINSKKAQEILKALVTNQHKLNISTLDSLFNKIANSFSLELGLSPNWRTEPEGEDSDFYLDVIGRICEKNPDKMLELLRLIGNDESSIKVISSINRKVTELHQIFRSAPADSWKWVKYNGEQFLNDEQLKEQINKVKNLDTTDYNKSMTKVLKKILEELSRGEWFDFVKEKLIQTIVDTKGNHKYSNSLIPTEVEEALLPLAKHAVQDLIRQLKIQNESTLKLLQLFHDEYEAARAEDGTLSFEDITIKLKEAELTTDLDTLYYRLDSRIRHLLLDEFQDTSAVQWQIIAPLADEIMASAGIERSFFCVGDLKQAIYSWRGGESEVFASLENRWTNLAIETKEKTYRCSQPVLDTVNTVFSTLTENPAFKDYGATAGKWQKNFKDHSSAIGNSDGYVTFTEFDDDGCDINQIVADTAMKILERHPDFTIGILTRKKASFSELKNAFSKLSNPPEVSVEGKSPLTDSIAVNACLALLHIIDHPADEVARFILRNDPLGIVIKFPNTNDINIITEFAKRERLTISKIGYGEYFSNIVKLLHDSCSAHDIQRLEQLAELGFSRNDWSAARIEDFAELVEKTYVETPSSAKIRIMTIHKSKGLEFDAVILPDLNSRIFKNESILRDRPDPLSAPRKVSLPSNDTLRSVYPELQEMYNAERATKLEEALCLLYVAMTRAKTELHMFTEAGRNDLSYRLILKNALAPESNEYVHGTPSVSTIKKQKTSVKESTIPEVKENPIRRHTVKRPSDLSSAKKLEYSLELQGKSLNLGTILHTLLQQVIWTDEPLPSKEALIKNIKVSATEEELEKGYSLFERALSFSEFHDALSRKRYQNNNEVEVFREQRFSVLYKDELISGAFDRLIVSYNSKHQIIAAEILDFKSDYIPNQDNSLFLQEKIALYTPQLEAYREAASVFLKIPQDKIKASLVFARVGKVVEV